MGLFSLTQEIAVDLGTANTIIIHNNKIVVDEPSYVALDSKGRLVAVGEQAKMMQGKEHSGIRTIRPLRDGVIADFNAAELMIRGLIKMVSSKRRWFSPSLRIVVCIPSGSTEVEIRAVRDSSEHAGGRDVYMIYEPMAAALGIGLDVEAPEGNMIVDIGGGTTEIDRRHTRAHEARPQHESGRTHGRTHQNQRGSNTHRNGKSAGRLHRAWAQPNDCLANGSAGILSRNFPLHREINFKNRSRHSKRVGEYAARTLCRHRQKRHIPFRRRRIAQRPRQAAY